MEKLIELTVEQLARTLDIPKDAAGFLLLVLTIFLFAWTVSWLFLPWKLYSKLDTIAERLGSISGKLTNMSDRLDQIRNDTHSSAEGVKRLNERIDDIKAEISGIGLDLVEKKSG